MMEFVFCLHSPSGGRLGKIIMSRPTGMVLMKPSVSDLGDRFSVRAWHMIANQSPKYATEDSMSTIYTVGLDILSKFATIPLDELCKEQIVITLSYVASFASLFLERASRSSEHKRHTVMHPLYRHEQPSTLLSSRHPVNSFVPMEHTTQN